MTSFSQNNQPCEIDVTGEETEAQKLSDILVSFLDSEL